MTSPYPAEEKAFFASVIFSSLPKETRYFMPANTKNKSDINAITESRYCIATITASAKLSTFPTKGLQKILSAEPQVTAAQAVFVLKIEKCRNNMHAGKGDIKCSNFFLGFIFIFIMTYVLQSYCVMERRTSKTEFC